MPVRPLIVLDFIKQRVFRPGDRDYEKELRSFEQEAAEAETGTLGNAPPSQREASLKH